MKVQDESSLLTKPLMSACERQRDGDREGGEGQREREKGGETSAVQFKPKGKRSFRISHTAAKKNYVCSRNCQKLPHVLTFIF